MREYSIIKLLAKVFAGGAVLDDVGAYVVDQAHQQGDVGPHAEGPAGPVGVVQAEAVAGEEIVDAGGAPL